MPRITARFDTLAAAKGWEADSRNGAAGARSREDGACGHGGGGGGLGITSGGTGSADPRGGGTNGKETAHFDLRYLF